MHTKEDKELEQTERSLLILVNETEALSRAAEAISVQVRALADRHGIGSAPAE